MPMHVQITRIDITAWQPEKSSSFAGLEQESETWWCRPQDSLLAHRVADRYVFVR
jgi:hypothetical protein